MRFGIFPVLFQIESEESDGDVPGIHPAEHQETAPTGTDVTPDMLDGVTKHMSKRYLAC